MIIIHAADIHLGSPLGGLHRHELELLGEVAESMQVIFLTHHRRLVELAEKVVPSDRLDVVELGAHEEEAA